jgi:hypothetical protein
MLTSVPLAIDLDSKRNRPWAITPSRQTSIDCAEFIKPEQIPAREAASAMNVARRKQAEIFERGFSRSELLSPDRLGPSQVQGEVGVPLFQHGSVRSG